jgi:membrane protease YdiL (CAAX protease family)
MTEPSGRDNISAPEQSSPAPSTLRQIFLNERELRAGWRLLIYVALLVPIILMLSLIAVWLHLPLPRPGSMGAVGLLLQELILAGGAFGAALLMARFEHRSIGIYGLPARKAFRGHFWQGVVWGLAMITAIILLIRLWGGFSFGNIDLGGRAILHYALIWAAVFLMVGFFEEFTFRGYTQFTLASGIRFWPAAIVLSAAFGSVHLMNVGEGPVGALSVFTIAMFFCLTLRRTGNLWFAVGLHASFDWGETYLYSVPNSGVVARGHLLNSSLHGPAWLSGGTVGPEGSVMAFVVMGAAFVVFALVYRKRPAEPDAASAITQN